MDLKSNSALKYINAREGVIIDSGQILSSIDAHDVIIKFWIDAFEEDDDGNDPEKHH